jgi:hypothetical protein
MENSAYSLSAGPNSADHRTDETAAFGSASAVTCHLGLRRSHRTFNNAYRESTDLGNLSIFFGRPAIHRFKSAGAASIRSRSSFIRRNRSGALLRLRVCRRVAGHSRKGGAFPC